MLTSLLLHFFFLSRTRVHAHLVATSLEPSKGHPQSRSNSHQSDRELKSRLYPRRLVAVPSNLTVMSDQLLLYSSQEPPSTRSPRLDGFVLIVAHWTIQATRSKFLTPLIKSSVVTVLHLAPCPSLDRPVQALHGVELIHDTFMLSSSMNLSLIYTTF
jgi:hypothetical protein